MKVLLIIVVIAAGIAGGVYVYANRHSSAQTVHYRSQTIELGDLTQTVGATGTVEPEEVVDVGAQVIGKVNTIASPRGKTDPAFKNKTIDYGSPVEEGMLLAQIDPSVYSTRGIRRKQTSIALTNCQLQAKFEQTEAEWKQAQNLPTADHAEQPIADWFQELPDPRADPRHHRRGLRPRQSQGCRDRKSEHRSRQKCDRAGCVGTQSRGDEPELHHNQITRIGHHY